MTRIKPYNKYKPSGIPWLGHIPEHWEVRKLKYNANILNGYAFKSDEYKDFGTPIVRIGDLKNESFVNITGKYVSTEFKEIAKIFIIKKHDILVALTGATIGKSSVYNHSEVALLNQRVGLIRNNPNFNQHYLHKVIASNAFIEYVKLECGGSAQENIGKPELNNFLIQTPPLSEQIAIANFLDYKTAKIDRFIRKKKQLIKLLNEQKAAIINDAVTKGLNPQAKMKPSGIEWLGNIPEHWEIKKLKYIVSLNDETLGEKTNPDYELRYIDIGNVSEFGVIDEIVSYKFKDAPSRAKRIVRDGDVIISTVRTYLKAITQISADCENLIVSTGFAVLRPNHKIYSDFLNFTVRANYFIQKVCSESFGVSYPAINASELITLQIAFPSISEQTAIVLHIEKETATINKTIATIEREIALVQEYRTALIAEAVTGKIDVRGYQIPEETNAIEYQELEEELELKMVTEEETEYQTEELE